MRRRLRLLHLVPRLPPVFDGVGDYAIHLARHLRSLDTESSFIVADPNWRGSLEIDEMMIARLPFPSASALYTSLATTSFDRLILHYVGYGFARRGAPFWLLAALRKWRVSPIARTTTGRPLLTIFHELWASGRPWQSAFYLSWAQRWIVRSLYRLS